MATGWPMKTTYANGDVYSASDVNDITGTINLLQTSTLSNQAGKNAVINGGMDIWQRGTSITASTSATNYSTDRWAIIRPANASAITCTRQATSDTTNLAFIQYCARIQRTAASATTDVPFFATSLESVNSIPFAGKVVVFSFYARRGANYSAASNVLNFQVVSGTGTDQNVYSGFTGAAAVINTTATLTTTWQRFTATATVSASATQLGAYFYYTPTGTAGAADFFEVTGVQLELGSTATTFSRAGGTIQGELAACQRYYWRNTPNGSNSYLSTMGTGATTSIADMIVAVPVPMRVIPTVLETSTIRLLDGSNAFSTGTWTLNTSDSSTTYPIIRYTHGSAALTQFRPYFIAANGSSAAYLGLGAEL